MGVRRAFSSGGNVDILFIIFKLPTINVPSKIIFHWENVCFSEHDYFRAEYVEFSINNKFCELYNKYTIWPNRNKIIFHWNSFLFACSSIAFECCKYARMRFNCATVLVVLSVCTLRGKIADDAMQMDVHKTLYPFYTTKEMPMLREQSPKTLRWQQYPDILVLRQFTQ